MKKLLTALIILTLTSCGGNMKKNSSLVDGIFQPCPSSPNCVSSMDDGKRSIKPLIYTGDAKQVMMTVKQVAGELPGASLVEEEANYLHYTVKSRVFGFIDDLEIYLPEEQQTVHLRSASRVGYYDFGVNRSRVDRLKKMLQQTQFFQ